MFNTLDDLKALCGKSADDFEMDDVVLLSNGKSEWVCFLEAGSDFAFLKISQWGFVNSDIEKLKKAEVYLLKAYLAQEQYNQSASDVAQTSVTGYMSVSYRRISAEEINLIVKNYLDLAYHALSLHGNESGRDFVLKA